MQNDTNNFEIPIDILDDWQEIVDVLSEIIEIPAALIMRVKEPHIEVFVSSDTRDNPYHSGEKELLHNSGLYCETVIKTQEKLLVPDALADVKWKDNPDVRLDMISYLGFPILLPDKSPFGTICILDNKPNKYSLNIEKLMLKFRNLIESHLEIVYMNHVLGEKNKRLTDYIEEMQVLRGIVPICSSCKSIRDVENHWHSVEHYLSIHPETKLSHSICPSCMKKLYAEFNVNE